VRRETASKLLATIKEANLPRRRAASARGARASEAMREREKGRKGEREREWLEAKRR
jgi:hypothetical protein